MGRPKTAVIEDYNAKLTWFSLGKYARLKDLDLSGWYKQITIRRFLYGRLTDELPSFLNPAQQIKSLKQASGDFLDAIKDDPIIDLDKYFWIGEPGTRPRLPVHPTTIEEFYLAEIAANPTRTEKARRFFDKAKELKHKVTSVNGHIISFYGSAAAVAVGVDSELLITDQFNENDYHDDEFMDDYTYDYEIRAHGWAETALHDYLRLHGSAVFSVDLNSSDAVLVRQFREELKKSKRGLQDGRTAKLNPKDWVRCGLLPYIDLELWRLIDALPKFGKNVEETPDPVIRDLILPSTLRRDHTVRAVTRDHFEHLMVGHSSAYALLESIIAGYPHPRKIRPSAAQKEKQAKGGGVKKEKKQIQ